MQQLHQGSQHNQGGWGANGWSGQDQKPAMSSAYPPHSQGYGDLATNATSVDDLVAGAARKADDHIDEVIRMAEAGIRPPKKSDTPSVAVSASETNVHPAPTPATAPVVEPEKVEKNEAVEKKSKKDKPMKMIYSDNDISPEEKMSKLPRYAYIPEVKTETSLVDAASVPGIAGTVDT